MSNPDHVANLVELLRREFDGMVEVPGIKRTAYERLIELGADMEAATLAVVRWIYPPSPSGTCRRCGGHHDAAQCLTEDLVSELAQRFGLKSDAEAELGPTVLVEEAAQYLQGLGAAEQAAWNAIARWIADNDA